MQRKIFPLWGGVRGVRGWWGGSASSEDQIGVNFLSVFRFSREKSFFFQICLECAETSRNEKKISTFWRGEGLKSQKVEHSTFFIFFFDHFPKKQFMIKRIINIISIPVIVLYWPSFLYLSSYIIIVQIYQTKQIDDNIIPHRAHLGLGVLTLWCLFWLLSLKA